jgi:hypothetical protein
MPAGNLISNVFKSTHEISVDFVAATPGLRSGRIESTPGSNCTVHTKYNAGELGQTYGVFNGGNLEANREYQ